jgi:hypothetical protein
MNNSVFGKTTENIKKPRGYNFVFKRKERRKAHRQNKFRKQKNFYINFGCHPYEEK